MTTDLALNASLVQMVEAYHRAEKGIRAGYELIEEAETLLKANFNGQYREFDLLQRYDGGQLVDVEKRIEALRREAWKCLIEKMEIRRVLSVSRWTELEKKLKAGEMPPLTLDEVMAQMASAYENVSIFLEEAVKEVFEYLRPPRSKFKTNTEFEIGKRVILAGALSGSYTGAFYVSEYRHKYIRAMDNVFHTLDGKGIPQTYYGPLCEAIQGTTTKSHRGCGETDYFKFRCHKNGNLHIEFKRLDLVDKLNQMAGGNKLRPAQTK